MNFRIKGNQSQAYRDDKFSGNTHLLSFLEKLIQLLPEFHYGITGWWISLNFN